MIWPFKKKPKDERGWTDDFNVGDLVKCTNDDWQTASPFHPAKDDILRVSALDEGLGDSGALVSVLVFEGKPKNLAWENRCFKKLPKDTTEAEDKNWLRDLLNTPAKQGEKA